MPNQETASVEAAAPEWVGRGVAFAFGAIPVGAVAAGVLGWFGFFPPFCILILVSAAFALYRKGAGRDPRRGGLGLAAVLVAGFVTCYLIVHGVRLAALFSAGGADPGQSLVDFVAAQILHPTRFSYWDDLLLSFGIFGLIGLLPSLWPVIRRRRAPA